MTDKDVHRSSRRRHPPGKAPVKEKKSALEDALEDAYKKARADGGHPPFRVEAIILEGTNPLTDYVIELSSGH